MTISFRFIQALFKKLFNKTRPCTHCRAMNPDEKQWKDCCRVFIEGDFFFYRCCKCKKTDNISF